MAALNKTLQLIASKMGLQDEEKVMRRAAEFERLLQTKCVTGSNMTDNSKMVICLDLAALQFGVELDTKMAIKYSGLKPSMYASSRKVIENLLEINNNRLNVPALCLLLECTGVQTLAENILKEYQKQAKMEIDLNLPLYVCMAVYQACRLNKVKVSKSKFVQKSRIKPAQWAKLEAEWAKFVDVNFAPTVKKRGRPPKTAVVSCETENAETENGPKADISIETKIEPYEDWKKRMLQTAYEELKALQEQLRNKKRRSDNMEDDSLVSNELKSPKKNVRQRKNSHVISPKKNNVSPRKNQNLTSAKISQGLSSSEWNTRRLSPRKHYQMSSKNNAQLKSSKDIQMMSPRKNIQLMSPRKDSQLMSPRKVSQLMSPKEETQYLSERKSTGMSPMQEDMSPRRSPRKTPQKLSPYKTPVKCKTVRLLFPNNL